MGYKSYKGFFIPKFPAKYKGNANNIVFRSMLEYTFMKYCDLNSNVLEWKSEEFYIPYIYSVDNTPHRYFIDIWIKAKLKTGETKEYLIEIKPHSQTKEPKLPKKKTKRYIEDVLTYVKNQDKWKAAEEYARKNGMVFKILTEKEINPKYK